MKQLGPSIGPPRRPLAPQILIKGFLTHRAAALLRRCTFHYGLTLLGKMGLDC